MKAKVDNTPKIAFCITEDKTKTIKFALSRSCIMVV